MVEQAYSPSAHCKSRYNEWIGSCNQEILRRKNAFFSPSARTGPGFCIELLAATECTVRCFRHCQTLVAALSRPPCALAQLERQDPFLNPL